MTAIKKYFDIRELVCPHVYERDGEGAWIYFDPRLLETLLAIRERINRPIFVNNWDMGGNLSQRGLRCNCCALVKEKTNLEKVYMTAHSQGMGVDFNVQGMTTDEVHLWLTSNAKHLPHPIRVEINTTTWIHIDVRSDGRQKLTWFKG